MTEFAREMDVRPLAPPQRHAEVFRMFDALLPGQAMLLVNDHEPKPLLKHFQTQRSDLFDWSVLERGPERFRVAIRRRAQDGTRNVTEYLEGDHQRLDALLDRVQQSSEAGAFAEASESFSEFACGLDWHIGAEEHVLFPAFEKASHMIGGPTMVMRGEHIEIRRRMEGISRALAEGRADEIGPAIDELREVLAAHNMKEEHMLYPMADEAMGSPGEQDELVRRIQAF